MTKPSRFLLKIPIRTLLGWVAFCASCGFLLLTWASFVRQLDHLALLTVLPIWLWALSGTTFSLLAWWGIRSRFVSSLLFLWISLIGGFADEAKVLWNGSHALPMPGPAADHRGKPVIRVVTANCAHFKYGATIEDIARWQPDIVLLQDTYPFQTRQIAMRLFGNTGHHTKSSRTTGIASRWPITREIATIATRCVQATIELPGEIHLEVVNLHLHSASTDLRIWKRSAWTNHRINRAHRLNEITSIHQLLTRSTAFPMTPVLLGGDFNAPATDVVHQHMSQHFQDSFLQAGSGWGNTYHRQFPILRIDYLYHSFHFMAVRSKTIETAHSDHRMVVADYLLHQ